MCVHAIPLPMISNHFAIYVCYTVYTTHIQYTTQLTLSVFNPTQHRYNPSQLFCLFVYFIYVYHIHVSVYFFFLYPYSYSLCVFAFALAILFVWCFSFQPDLTGCLTLVCTTYIGSFSTSSHQNRVAIFVFQPKKNSLLHDQILYSLLSHISLSFSLILLANSFCCLSLSKIHHHPFAAVRQQLWRW